MAEETFGVTRPIDMNEGADNQPEQPQEDKQQAAESQEEQPASQGQEQEQAKEEQPVSEQGTTEEAGSKEDTPEKSEEGKAEESQTDDLKQYKPADKDASYGELEKKLTELGQNNSKLSGQIKEYREFYDEVLPVIEAIQKDPELTQAVIGKLYPDQAKQDAGQNGSQPDAQQQNQQSQGVKQDVSTQDLAGAQANRDTQIDPEKIKQDILKEVEKQQQEQRQNQEFERDVEKYISDNKISNDMLSKIVKVIDEKDINDIEVAHRYVLADELQKNREKEQVSTEEKKEDARATSGASVSSQGAVPTEPNIDDFIKVRGNANTLGA